MRTAWLVVTGASLLVYACTTSNTTTEKQTGTGGSVGTGGAGDGGSAGSTTGGSQNAPLCSPGDTRTCVGPGACAGGQECNDDGTDWSTCDCGSGSGGAEPGTGGAAGGGANTGGTSTGGTNSGGSSTGGVSTGGVNMGGSNTGGSGGSNTGGSSTGGTGSSAMTCGQNLGILNAYYDNGTMCGYAFTAANKNAGADIPGTSIAPSCGAGPCFTGDKLCATGVTTLPKHNPDSNDYSGVMIGWNVAQAMGSPTVGTYATSGTGITVNYTATGATGEIRVVLQTGEEEYCAPVTSGTAVAWSSFKTICWHDDVNQTPFAIGTPIKAILLWIDGSYATDQSITEFCLDSITND